MLQCPCRVGRRGGSGHRRLPNRRDRPRDDLYRALPDEERKCKSWKIENGNHRWSVLNLFRWLWRAFSSLFWRKTTGPQPAWAVWGPVLSEGLGSFRRNPDSCPLSRDARHPWRTRGFGGHHQVGGSAPRRLSGTCRAGDNLSFQFLASNGRSEIADTIHIVKATRFGRIPLRDRSASVTEPLQPNPKRPIGCCGYKLEAGGAPFSCSQTLAHCMDFWHSARRPGLGMVTHRGRTLRNRSRD